MFSSRRIFKNLSSLKLAVIVITYLCIVTGVGTVVESRLDAQAAKTQVYDSLWMYFGLGGLALSLIAVMVDRWPWKKRHAPFLLAHVGIIALLIGSVQTLRWGVDGSMNIPIGQKLGQVTISESQILVYASFDGNRLSKIFEKDVNFFRQDPRTRPLSVNTEAGEFKFVEFAPYVIPQRLVDPSEDNLRGAGLRFQVSNGQFQHIDWLVQKKAGASVQNDLGPLRVRLGENPHRAEMKNEVVLIPMAGDELSYKIFSKDSDKVLKTGIVKEGQQFDLGWMGMKLKVLRYHPQALERWDIQPRERPTPLTVSAVKMNYQDADHWILLNDTLRIFTDSTAYFVSFVNKRIDLGFDLTLKEFIKENYAGTQKAMAYKSLVEVPGGEIREISMNEPLNWQGLTFYQASFQEDEMGQPTSSVLSVNYDPGRFLKYAGSLIMSLGIILLFYNRRQKPVKGAS